MGLNNRDVFIIISPQFHFLMNKQPPSNAQMQFVLHRMRIPYTPWVGPKIVLDFAFRALGLQTDDNEVLQPDPKDVLPGQKVCIEVEDGTSRVARLGPIVVDVTTGRRWFLISGHLPLPTCQRTLTPRSHANPIHLESHTREDLTRARGNAADYIQTARQFIGAIQPRFERMPSPADKRNLALWERTVETESTSLRAIDSLLAENSPDRFKIRHRLGTCAYAENLLIPGPSPAALVASASAPSSLGSAAGDIAATAALVTPVNDSATASTLPPILMDWGVVPVESYIVAINPASWVGIEAPNEHRDVTMSRVHRKNGLPENKTCGVVSLTHAFSVHVDPRPGPPDMKKPVIKTTHPFSVYCSDGGSFAVPGDSGAAIVAKGTNHVVGIVQGGPVDGFKQTPFTFGTDLRSIFDRIEELYDLPPGSVQIDRGWRAERQRPAGLLDRLLRALPRALRVALLRALHTVFRPFHAAMVVVLDTVSRLFWVGILIVVLLWRGARFMFDRLLR